MASYSKKHQLTEKTSDEAMRIARGTQQPGQTAEQTKLIAKGIRKGIEQYRKQQNARSRELDRRLKKAGRTTAPAETATTGLEVEVVYRQHWLPWVLLVLSWLAMAVFWLLS